MELGSGGSHVGLDLDREDRIRSPMASVDLDREASGAPVAEVDLGEQLPSPPRPTSWPPNSSGRREAWSSGGWSLEVRGDEVVFWRREEKD